MDINQNAAVITATRDGIGSVILNRPEALNAIDRDFGAALAQAVTRVVSDPTVRVILLRAEGRAFSVGGDLASMAHSADLAALLGEIIDLLSDSVQQLRDTDKPVVSAVQGALGGGGIGLALSADVVVCDTNLKMRCGYAAIGLSPDVGASCFLSERVGEARARALFMTNRALSADDCLALGIVDQVVAREDLQDEALRMARQLAEAPATSMAVIKSLCNRLRGDALARHLRAERDGMVRCGATEDAAEGIRAFLDKRKPVFGRHS